MELMQQLQQDWEWLEKFKEVSSVLCGRGLSLNLKGIVYKSADRSKYFMKLNVGL